MQVGQQCIADLLDITSGSDGDCTITYDFSYLKLYERQEIIDPLPSAKPRLRSRYSVPMTQIPQEQWAEIARRHADGESLRVLGRAYGVSHEAIRQIIKRCAW